MEATTNTSVCAQATRCTRVMHRCLKRADAGRGNTANPDAGHVAFHFETRGTGMRGFTGKAEKCASMPRYSGSWVVGYRGRA